MCYLQLVPKLSLFAALLGSCIAFTPHGFVRKPFGSLAANKLQKRPSDSPSSASSVVALGSLQEEGRALADRLTGVPVYLVGMMGSGKSTVGNIFCKALGSYSFLETDALVEKAAGCTVAEFFESEGEDQFRQVESAVLTQVSSFVRTVVSTGGGIVTVDANWGKLQRSVSCSPNPTLPTSMIHDDSFSSIVLFSFSANTKFQRAQPTRHISNLP